jgi:hypothetical protein
MHHAARILPQPCILDCSAPTFSRGSLYPTYRKPFDILAKTDRIENWRPIVDDFRNWVVLPQPTVVDSLTSRCVQSHLCPI